MSGASLAGVARAAASHALERVVGEYTDSLVQGSDSTNTMMDCLVTKEDFRSAISDVNESAGDSDWELTEEEQEDFEEDNNTDDAEQSGTEGQ